MLHSRREPPGEGETPRPRRELRCERVTSRHRSRPTDEHREHRRAMSTMRSAPRPPRRGIRDEPASRNGRSAAPSPSPSGDSQRSAQPPNGQTPSGDSHRIATQHRRDPLRPSCQPPSAASLPPSVHLSRTSLCPKGIQPSRPSAHPPIHGSGLHTSSPRPPSRPRLARGRTDRGFTLPPPYCAPRHNPTSPYAGWPILAGLL